MIEPNSTPSGLLKAGAAMARWMLWLLALAWIALVLVWGGLHFLIVPRISELRPWVELQASKALGLSVRIGAIVAQSNGLISSLELQGVRLLNTNNAEVLLLPKVLVSLSPRSVLNLGFDRIYIGSPVLDVRRSVDGQIWVAGLPVSGDGAEVGAGADWLFSQSELAIEQGSLRWSDELSGAPPIMFTGIDLVLRNRLVTHALRVDANPPPEWGDRIRLVGVFGQTLWSRHPGQWREWTGQIFADFPQVDVGQMRRSVDMGVDVAQGAGALRAWVDVDDGAWKGVTLDLALQGVSARIDPKRDALGFDWIAGRLGVKRLKGGLEYSTQALEFDTPQGLHWSGGNVRVGLFSGDADNSPRGEIVADRLDLAAMAQIADRMPLGEGVQTSLRQFSPQGLIDRVQGSWEGSLTDPTRLTLRGRATRLAMTAVNNDAMHVPGFKGADIDFAFTPQGGKARLAMHQGFIDAPGVFEEPVIPVEQLGGELQWKIEGDRLSLNIANLRFTNADMQGELQGKWRTAETVGAEPGNLLSRFPGVLDLQGKLNRADGARIYRYFPLVLEKTLRDYLRDSIVAGTASAVKFRVKGDLNDFPFVDAAKGEFRVSASVRNMTFDFAPSRFASPGELPWPVLKELSGELEIGDGTLKIKGAHAALARTSGLKISKADAVISQLYDQASLVIVAEARGPLQEALGVVNGSPLDALTDKALAHASATGNADYRLKLVMPLDDMERATVQGTVTLAGNDLQISAETPRLARAYGQVAFTESGFSITGGQARILGGDARIDGGLSGLGSTNSSSVPSRLVAPSVLRVQGTASAEGLRQAKELGLLARLAQYADGAAPYTAAIGLRAGMTELQINSSLTGLALNLPAPFAKEAEAALPLRLETTVLRSSAQPGDSAPGLLQDQVKLELGRLASVVYVRDISGAQARVLRGAIAVGLTPDESAPLPAQGVVANIRVDRADMDAWEQVLSKVSDSPLTPDKLMEPGASMSMSYLPTSLAVRANELQLNGRQLNRVVLGGTREGLLWRANVDASELSGYVEYRQPTGTTTGRVHGRLARLVIGQSSALDVENLLDEQPASIPALDVVVEDFELRGKKLGRVEIEATNLGGTGVRDAPKEWRLNRFNITTPEAVFAATGNWTNINTLSDPAGSRTIKDRRRTVLNFKLDIRDGGELLGRFGMSGVVRKGRGKIDGQVAWLGSPITLDYPSMAGNFNVSVETGQFLKAEPGIAKLLGVLSLQALPRRLALDFRDVFSQGFAFDFLRGDVVIEQGIARTNNLQMKGVNAAVLMEGKADFAKETQAIKVVVVPEINAGSASLIASAINPVVGLTSFLAQWILRRPLMDAATQEFFVDGTWVEPRVTRVKHQTMSPSQTFEQPTR